MRKSALGLKGVVGACALSLSQLAAVAPAAAVPTKGPTGVVWEARVGERGAHEAAVDALLEAHETSVGERLRPGDRGKVGLKVNTRGGRGLSTPLPLLRAVIAAMEARGFPRNSILIVDGSEHSLRQAGILSPLSLGDSTFEGCPVLALDSGRYFDREWYYDSPLPPSRYEASQVFADAPSAGSLEEGDGDRKSFLPMPLMFEVDFWINLAVGVDGPTLGVDGVLASATLWNVSNSHRFLENAATASAAVAEIAAIPELEERMILHFVSLERYQFIGGPYFNSRYTRAEPKLWMSRDPVALDRLLYERMNKARLLEGLPEIDPVPRQFSFAASLGLGEFQRSRIRIREVATPIGGEGAGAPKANAGAGAEPVQQ